MKDGTYFNSDAKKKMISYDFFYLNNLLVINVHAIFKAFNTSQLNNVSNKTTSFYVFFY